MEKKRLTLVSLTVELRRQLVEAIEKNDRTRVTSLWSTFVDLQLASYASGDEQATSLFVDLEDAARDALGDGATWRVDLPSEVTIHETLQR